MILHLLEPDFIFVLRPLSNFRDLQEDLIKIQKSGLSQMETTKRLLSNQIEELKILHSNPRPEIRTDFQNIKTEMLESFKAMQKENSVILSELTEMKELVKKIFHLVVQISYKVRKTINFRLLFTLLAPSETQGVTLSVCPSGTNLS